MKLYHYTSVFHLLKIQEDGYLKTTESNASFRVEHAANDVVWLTENHNPQKEKSLIGSIVDKMQVRFTVDVEAVPYLEWARKNKVDIVTRKALNSSGGGQSHKWYVIEREIPKSNWAKIELFDYKSNRWRPYSPSLHNLLLSSAEDSLLKAYPEIRLSKTLAS